MNILIFNGSARKNGFTKKMIDYFLNAMGEVAEIIDAYKFSASPCIDCRYCWKNRGCAVKDDMQAVYEKIDQADLIIFASPMYFHTVSGPLKMIIDRLQMYWAGHVRNDMDGERKKMGAVLMCGGAPRFSNQFLGGETVLVNTLADLNAECMGIVKIEDTDKAIFEEALPVLTDLELLAAKIKRLSVSVL